MSEPIHIHEDEWGMRTLHPITAWDQVCEDVRAAIASGERNRVEDGLGWTDVHIIGEPDHDFTQVGLELAAIASDLERIMPRVRRFAATSFAGLDSSHRDPYGSYEDHAWAFGFDASCFIKLEPRDDLVCRIWFEARTSDAARLAALRQAIERIDSATECLIADYWADGAGRVRDAAFMARYFQWLAE